MQVGRAAELRGDGAAEAVAVEVQLLQLGKPPQPRGNAPTQLVDVEVY